ncbi:MAG: LexA family protein, partial [Burkholderiaceae bacterium]
MIGLTPRQRECFECIEEFMQRTGGVAPSYEQLRSGLGWKANSSVGRILKGLEERGYIRRIPNRARAIEVIRPVAQPTINGEPLMWIPVHAPKHRGETSFY